VKTLAWDDRALDDLDAIGDYIAANNPAAAVRVIEYVRRAARSLETSPSLGKATSKTGVREFVLTRYPYLLVYELAGDEVRILAVFHHRQRRP